jgi:hypothetical protein
MGGSQNQNFFRKFELRTRFFDFIYVRNHNQNHSKLLFFQSEPEVLQKSKEAPKTGTYYISLSSFLFLMQRDRASSVVFGKRKALTSYTK